MTTSTRTIVPSTLLLARVGTWCGVTTSGPRLPTLVYVKGRPIARIVSNEAVEVVLCGSLRDQLDNEQVDSLPEGFWPRDGNRHVLIDLTAPGGMEEAVRTMLNVYMISQSPEARDWWFRQDHLEDDPTCERLHEAVQQYRASEQRA